MDEPPLVDPPRYDFSEILFRSGQPTASKEWTRYSLMESQSIFDALDKIKMYISAKNGIRFGVVGFSDSAECDLMSCLELSNRRAELFFNFLLDNGVSSENIIGWKGLGDKNPVDSSVSEEHSRRNRRVEIRVFDPAVPGYERWDD